MSDLPLSPRKRGEVIKLNPVKYDPELKELLEKSHDIQSTNEFNRWKKSFLNRLEEIVGSSEGGKVKAEASYEHFSDHMNRFSKVVVKLQKCLADGKSLTATSTSVKGRNALNEVNAYSTSTMKELQDWMPTIRKEEIFKGYSKWQLGAVLVQNGFQVYSTMILCRDALNRAVQECLQHVADRQTLDAISYFDRQITRFCDVMADLGLYELMVDSNNIRSHEFKQSMSNGSITISDAELMHESLDLLVLEDEDEEESMQLSFYASQATAEEPPTEEPTTVPSVPSVPFPVTEEPSEVAAETPDEVKEIIPAQPKDVAEPIIQPTEAVENSDAASESETVEESKHKDLVETAAIPEKKIDPKPVEPAQEVKESEDSLESKRVESKEKEPVVEETVVVADPVEVVDEVEDSEASAESDTVESEHEDIVETATIPEKQTVAKPIESSAQEVEEESSESERVEKEPAVEEAGVVADPVEVVEESESSAESETVESENEDVADPVAQNEEVDDSSESSSESETVESQSEVDQDEKEEEQKPVDDEQDGGGGGKPETADDIDNGGDGGGGPPETAEKADEDGNGGDGKPDADDKADGGGGGGAADPKPDDKGKGKGKGGGKRAKVRPHLRVQLGSSFRPQYHRQLKHDDCVVVPDLFGEEEDLSNYDLLLQEVNKSAQLHEEGTFMVWENASSPKIDEMKDKVVEYFGLATDSIQIQAQLFRGSTDGHKGTRDPMAFKSAKVKQLPYNIALRLSFGAERELALKDGSTNIHIPQTNNSVCTLGRDVNVRFEHELDRAEEDAGASICLRIYGKAKSVTEEEGSPELLEDGSGEDLEELGDGEAE